MINFSPDMLTKVLKGEKTRTWRPLKKGELIQIGLEVIPFDLVEVTGVSAVFTHAGRLKWKVGQRHAVGRGRGKPGVWINRMGVAIYNPIEAFVHTYDELSEAGGSPVSFEIRSLTRCSPKEISLFDAQLEGFESVEAFHDKLRLLYGKDFNFNMPGIAITWDALQNIIVLGE